MNTIAVDASIISTKVIITAINGWKFAVTVDAAIIRTWVAVLAKFRYGNALTIITVIPGAVISVIAACIGVVTHITDAGFNRAGTSFVAVVNVYAAIRDRGMHALTGNTEIDGTQAVIIAIQRRIGANAIDAGIIGTKVAITAIERAKRTAD